MFTAAPPFCQQLNTRLVLNKELAFTAAPASGQAVFSTQPFPAHAGQVYTGSAASGTLLTIQQTSTEATTFTYTLQYDGVMANLGYEGVIHFIGNNSVTFNAKVDVFGTVIFHGTITLPVAGGPPVTDTK